MNIQNLILEAKSKHINDPRMIASWIYNTKNTGLKAKQIKELVLSVAKA